MSKIIRLKNPPPLFLLYNRSNPMVPETAIVYEFYPYPISNTSIFTDLIFPIGVSIESFKLLEQESIEEFYFPILAS